MRPGRPLFALVLVGGSLALGLLLAEGAVRWLEAKAGERGVARGRYEEAYQAKAFRTDGLGEAGFLAPGFSGLVSDELGRPVPWIHNSLGFRRREEIAQHPAPGVLRVLMVGDSFVVGHRLAQDDTVGAQLEAYLRRPGGSPDAEVLIAAIEHPVTGLEYLERFGLAFEPRVVVLGLTLGNDVAQVYFTTGERGEYLLTPEGVAPNPAYDHAAAIAAVKALALPPSALAKPGRTPWNAEPSEASPASPGRWLRLPGFVKRAWEDRRNRLRPQAILSTWGEYSSPRLFDGNGLGLYLQPPPPEIEVAYQRLATTLLAYQRLCQRHGARFILLIHGQRYQIQPPDWQATVDAYGLEPRAFDLDAPNRWLSRLCQQEGLVCLDPTHTMAARYAEDRLPLFMPRGDMHWNTRGSRVFFALVRDELVRALEQPSAALPR